MGKGGPRGGGAVPLGLVGFAYCPYEPFLFSSSLDILDGSHYVSSMVIAAVALLGLCIGSFLNVVIHRLPRGGSVIRPRSRCPQCEQPISWYDNIPLFSYLVLGGRCRACQKQISLRYPIVELATAILALITFYYFPHPLLTLLYFCLLVAPLIAVAVIDLEQRLIPNEITLPGIAFGFLVHYIDGLPFQGLGPLLDSLFGVLAGGGFLFGIGFLYQKLKNQEGLGGGDVKLAAMLGAFFGWQGVIAILLFSSILGSVLGLAVVFWKKDFRYQLPFGVFLSGAALIQLFWGKELLFWYLSL